MSCFSDGSGYTEYRCNKSSELYEEHILRECHTDKTCKCYEHKTSESVMEMCECVNAAKRPKFPSTGVIRWNGTFVLNELSGESKTYVPGEVRKDSQGRFVMKTTSVHDWKQAEEPLKNMEFKIILPDVRTRMFIKVSFVSFSVFFLLKGNTLIFSFKMNDKNNKKKVSKILSKKQEGGARGGV